jgi:hypothetical protein
MQTGTGPHKIDSTGFFALLYTGLVILYGSVGYYSPGYDDEFFNIAIIEDYGLGAIAFAQSTDVHPPGSYLVDWALFTVFSYWDLVRLVISLAAAAVLIYAIESVKRRSGDRSALTAYFLLGLNPAILLYCTGLRWYAFFVPVLIWTSVLPETIDWRYWAKYFLGILLLGYFGYAFLLLALPLFFIYWHNDPRNLKRKLRSVAVFCALFAALYSYQLMVFLDVHLANKDDQVFSIMKGVVSFAVAQIGNQGVFPVSLGGLIASIGSIGILLIVLRCSLSINIKSNRYFLPYWIGVALFFVAGIAGKYRNFVLLSPWQALWVSTASVPDGKRPVFLFFLGCVAIGNLFGVFHVVTHEQTTKNSWNLPTSDVADAVRHEQSNCDDDLIIVTHDPTLGYILGKQGFRVLSIYSGSTTTPNKLTQRLRCVILLKTFAGSISDERISAMYDQLHLLEYKNLARRVYGLDGAHKMKQRLDPRYPKYQVELITYEYVDHLDRLTLWQPAALTPASPGHSNTPDHTPSPDNE